MSKALFAIALCAALAGCGKRQSDPEITATKFLTQECQYVDGFKVCMIRFNDGCVCRTYAGSMQCDPTTQGQSNAK